MNPIESALTTVCKRHGLDNRQVMRKIPELRELVEES